MALIFLLDIGNSQLNILKLKITEGPLLNLNQLLLTTTCLSYVQANSIDQVINIIIEEKYYGLTYISTHNGSRGTETCIHFCLTNSPNADFHWDPTQVPL